MILQSLLVAHIVVLGYWLDTDLIINITYRYTSYGGQKSFAEPSRLASSILKCTTVEGNTENVLRRTEV